MESFFNALRRLPVHRSRRRWLGGVCGGIAERYGWDPTLVRLVAVLLILLPFISAWLYPLLWILLPNWDNTIALERLLVGRAPR